ncbi:hypothetical protein PGTUg99_002397 [Puccinia graminis f. sp. tritici]|uniref:Uncharacterized protein n=1 Tax=Puccinia graminis f. sp. tritici TaxID=56615 RepID=A0A5B0N6G1_PUCGR|nr:hypothetical protein PGTUg99_002397 [Puccinia graminis f. sp. tritici]
MGYTNSIAPVLAFPCPVTKRDRVRLVLGLRASLSVGPLSSGFYQLLSKLNTVDLHASRLSFPAIDRDSTLKRARTQQTEHAVVIDRSPLANATEQENYTNQDRSLLGRLSSPIAAASSSQSLPSKPIDKTTYTKTSTNQNSSLHFERSAEAPYTVQQQPYVKN